MQAIAGKKISFLINDDLLKEIDRIAKRTGKTRVQTMRDLLYFGSDVFRDFEKIGVVKIAEIVKKSMESIRKEKGQQKLFD